MKYEIEYEPRIQDPVIVARFNSLEEAEAYMEVIKVKHPRGAAYHTIKENEDE
tara:strand:+ start:389 stop:547 length:159 start_codon:yes stop_codon:yes gene_type:complete